MAKVLQNFLIGVGLDTQQYDKGAKNVEGSLSRMRTLVGFTGTAFVGAMAAAGSSAIAAAGRIDDLNLVASGLRTAPDYIYAYGRALVALNGNASEAVTAINAAEDALDQFRLKGSFGPFEEAAFAGVREELNALMNARDGGELLRGLAGVMPSLDKGQQRLIQDAFSLSPAVMQSLRGGVDEFDAQIARAAGLLGDGFVNATEAARDFSRATAEFGTRLQGISDTMAENILPSFTGIIDSLGGFIDRNRDLVDRVTKENPEASTAVGAGAAAIGTGAALSTFGLGKVGGLLMRGGVAGAAIGAGLIAKDMRPDDIESLTGYRPNDYIFDNTLLDAARDAYNAVADKYGFERSEEGSGAISYLEGSYDRFNQQVTDFDDFLRRYAESGGREPVSVEPVDLMRQDVVESPTTGLVTPYEPWAPVVGDPYAGLVTPFEPVINVDTPYEPYPIVESASSGLVTPYESIYGGGEVGNIEAAEASPEVILVRAQHDQAERPAVTPRVNVQNHLDVRMELDGRRFDSRVVEVVERRERDAMDDVISSVNR